MDTKEALDHIRRALRASTEADNDECRYGARLGTCPPENECLACEASKVFDELDRTHG